MSNGLSFELKDYKITNVSLDISALSKGQYQIQLSTSINIMVPKDENDGKSVVEIKVAFNKAPDTNILSAILRGYSEFDAEVVKVLSNEEKQAMLKENAVPYFYNELRDYIENLLKLSHVDFMNIPIYEELSL